MIENPEENQDASEQDAKSDRAAEPLRGPLDMRSLALTGLFVLALFYTMYFTRALLLPIVLALLLSYLLAPLVRGLGWVRVPPVYGAGVVLIGLLATVTLLVSQLVEPAAGWIEKAPYSLHQVKEKLVPLKKPIQRVAEATSEIEKLTTPDESQKKTVVEVKRSRLAELAFSWTPDFVAQTSVMAILLYFLLAYDGIFLGKLLKVIPRFGDKKLAVAISREIESTISTYLVTTSLINIGLGVAIGTALSFLGLPNPVLWGAIAALFNFVPYLGAFAGSIALTLAALLSFDSLSYALVFPATYLLFNALENNLVTPMLLGRSLTLNPVVIVLSLIFWGWMWGIAGVILAVPILATCKIFCDHIEPLAPVSELLSA